MATGHDESVPLIARECKRIVFREALSVATWTAVGVTKLPLQLDSKKHSLFCLDLELSVCKPPLARQALMVNHRSCRLRLWAISTFLAIQTNSIVHGNDSRARLTEAKPGTVCSVEAGCSYRLCRTVSLLKCVGDCPMCSQACIEHRTKA